MSAGILACLAHMLSGFTILYCLNFDHSVVIVKALIRQRCQHCQAGAAPSLTSLYFSYGLLLPVPLAAIHTGWIVAVQKQFPESRGAATGVLMTGGGASLLSFSGSLRYSAKSAQSSS